ncbi:SDR family oxidoreductase [Candidatus Protochlamydia phocaeensis]|uniref:SDR family oxidoreductase n=1 Tax=Candidatus Protochlamydia phocaeensis TaxID=1414722 RepID=UPI000838687F|nr:SDR family oxidoreductase [Candidatus Protochlamydia phocaeensis]
MKTLILKVLILGGTGFLGPHLVEELQEQGHEVTLFNRGQHNPALFPEVEKLQGDRDGNLHALRGRKWDAIIDTSGYLPRVVEASSKILAQATDHYTFISSISVYENFHRFGMTEGDSVAQLDDEATEDINEKTYGALKARCETTIQSYFPNSLIIRPGLIVGPLDPTDRLTYWPVRLADGGDILAPGDPSAPIQLIDVRDLVKWIVKMVEEQATGVYNATGPLAPLTFGQLLNACQSLSQKTCILHWVSEDFLHAHQVQDWIELPLWLSRKRHMPGFLSVDVSKAIQAGLSFRPLDETLSAILKWNAGRSRSERKAGMEREKEQALLKEWQLEMR